MHKIIIFPENLKIFSRFHPVDLGRVVTLNTVGFLFGLITLQSGFTLFRSMAVSIKTEWSIIYIEGLQDIISKKLSYSEDRFYK